MAQLDLFAKIKVKNIYLLVLLVLSAFFIPKTKSQVEEIVTAPIIIYSSVVLVRYWKKIGKVLQYLGKQSFNMWIISSIVATPKATFQKIFIWPHQAILIYVNAVIVCLLFAIPITYLQDILISKLGKRNEHIRS